MLNSIKSFVITFCVAILIFGLVAWFVVGRVSETFGLVETTDTSSSSSLPVDSDITSGSENVNPPDTDVPPIEGPDGTSDITGEEETGAESEVSFNPEKIKGESFTMLLIGTDFLPEVLTDYPDELYILAEQKKAAAEAAETKENDTTVAPETEPESAEETTAEIEVEAEPPFGYKERTVTTDAIMLLRIDKERGEIMLSPIPGNLKVQSAGVYTMLGDIYSKRGAEYLCGIVTTYTGLAIDYYAVIDPDGLVEIIDSIEGIRYYVPQNMEYVDEVQGLNISLKMGTNDLTGEEVVDMLRFVGYPDGNTSRMKLAAEFLKAFIAKMTDEEMLEKVPDLYTALVYNVETNFSLADLTERLDLIFAYSKLTPVTLMYPANKVIFDGAECLEPSYSQALSQYKAYKIQ